MAACNACGKRTRLRQPFCSNCGARQSGAGEGELDDGPVLLSAVDPGRGGDSSEGTSDTSDTSVKSGPNTWAIGLGLALLGVVGWATLGIGPSNDAAADEAVASATTVPRSESSIETPTTLPRPEAEDAAPGIPFDLEDSVSDLTTPARSEAEYVLRTSAGLTPMEAVGEEFGFSLVAGPQNAPAFINPNDGTYTDVPIGPEGVSLLTENYAVQVVRVDGMNVLTARELWAVNSEPRVLLEADLRVEIYAGPNRDQVWLGFGQQRSRELLDLHVGAIIASEPSVNFRQQMSLRPSHVFSTRDGGIYERIGSTITKLSDEFGLAASDELFLVARCDAQAICTTVWLDRETLEPLDYPAADSSLFGYLIDPTSRWLALRDFVINEFAVVEIATGRRVFVTNNVWNAPEFSPDGQWLAFKRGGSSLIFVHLETGTEFNIDADTPSWRSEDPLVFFPPEYASGG